jgi:hypothetical protein
VFKDTLKLNITYSKKGLDVITFKQFIKGTFDNRDIHKDTIKKAKNCLGSNIHTFGNNYKLMKCGDFFKIIITI